MEKSTIIVKASFFAIHLILMFCHHRTMSFFKEEAYFAYNQNIRLNKEMDHIFVNLDEGIIQKTSHGIGFCNKIGYKIIEDIESIINNGGEDRRYLKMMEVEQKSLFSFDTYDKKPMKLREFEALVLNTPIFKLYQPITTKGDGMKEDNYSDENMDISHLDLEEGN